MNYIKVCFFTVCILAFSCKLFSMQTSFSTGISLSHHTTDLVVDTRNLTSTFPGYSLGALLTYGNQQSNYTTHFFELSFLISDKFDYAGIPMQEGEERMIHIPLNYAMRYHIKTDFLNAHILIGASLFLNYTEYGNASQPIIVQKKYSTFQIGPMYGFSIPIIKGLLSCDFIHQFGFGLYDTRFGFSLIPLDFLMRLELSFLIRLTQQWQVQIGVSGYYIINTADIVIGDVHDYDSFTNPILQLTDSLFIKVHWKL